MSENPPDNPQAPRIRPWSEVLEELKAEYPREFTNEPPSLKKQLKDMDEIIATEEHHLDNLEFNDDKGAEEITDEDETE